MFNILAARLFRKMLCSGSGFLPYAHEMQKNKSIYLTFDDGPDPVYSNMIMDTLAEYKIKATFFLIGNMIKPYPETVKRMVDEGHIAGNHSFSHKVQDRIPKLERIAEIVNCQNAILPFQQTRIKLFRPPQGLLNPADILFLFKKNFKIMLWTFDSNDYSHDPNISKRLIQQTKSKNIILLHDDSDYCLLALKEAIPYWLNEGFEFCVPDLS